MIEEAAFQTIHNATYNRIVHQNTTTPLFTKRAQTLPRTLGQNRITACAPTRSLHNVWADARGSVTDLLRPCCRLGGRRATEVRAAPGLLFGGGGSVAEGGEGCVRSESTSHVLASRPFLAGRVSFLSASIRPGRSESCLHARTERANNNARRLR